MSGRQAKVKRYFPGKIPHYAQKSNEVNLEPANHHHLKSNSVNQISVQSTISANQEDKKPPQDSRRQRLAEAQDSSGSDSDTEITRRRRRVLNKDENLTSNDAQGDTELNFIQEEAHLDHGKRRQMMLEKLQERERNDKISAAKSRALRRDETESESSDEESDSESEQEDRLDSISFKPVFKAKKERDTILDEETKKRLEMEEEERNLALKNQRREDSYKLVEQKVKNEVLGLEQEDGVEDLAIAEVDDTDGLNDREEYDDWAEREKSRLKRDKEEFENYIKELEINEIRRSMTDKERREDDLAQGIDRFHKERGQQKFMQRFYHKGAFFVEENAELLQRDYTAPTLEDKYNKEVLPEVMQKRNFGKKSQSKWTHLAAEDTSSRDAGWATNSEVNKRRMEKMAGVKGLQEIPAKSQKRRKL